MDLTFIDRALGSDIPYVTYAVPVFFLLIGVELVVALWEHKPFYRLHDSINDLSCGSTEQIVGVFLKGLLFAGYQGTYGYATRTGINLIEVHNYPAGGKWLAAILLFLAVDCAYYWFHRIAHEYNAPWAGHVVHHSSEDYNLAVALRQGSFQGVFSWVFWFMPQGWRPEGLPTNPIAPEVTHQSVIRYDTQVPRGLNAYALVHFAGTLPLAVGLMAAGESLPRSKLVVAAALVLWALLNIGGIFDHRRWALPSELLRLPVTAGTLAAGLPDGSWLAPALGGLALAVVPSWLCLLTYHRQFDGAPQPPSRVIGPSAPRAGAAESRPTVAAGTVPSPGGDGG